jgi:hypothetical protein
MRRAKAENMTTADNVLDAATLQLLPWFPSFHPVGVVETWKLYKPSSGCLRPVRLTTRKARNTVEHTPDEAQCNRTDADRRTVHERAADRINRLRTEERTDGICPRDADLVCWVV